MKNPLDHRLIEDCEIVRGLDEEVLQRKFYPILEKRINEDNCEEDILISNLQEYIVSLSQEEHSYPADLLRSIEKDIPSIEETSEASISRPGPDKLLFIGTEEQIKLALLLVEETSKKINMHDIQSLPLPKVKLPRYPDQSTTTLLGGTGVVGTAGDSLEERTSTDINRGTVVDSSDSEIIRSTSSSPNIYPHMVKLGYKREEVEAALKKFGENATMDNVLNYLVMQKDSSDPRIQSSYNNDTQQPLAVEEEEIDDNHSSNLKAIMIDGSNVAMSYGRNLQFDCRGIQIVVDYFLKRGHLKVYAFVPQFRRERNRADPTKNLEILDEMVSNGNITFTPSRRIRTRRIVSYDDRYVLDAALEFDGVVVSNDHFRDFLEIEGGKYKKIIEEQLLMYTFVEDLFMPTKDPLGRHGPSLDDFLKKKPNKRPQMQRCPYGARCTFGNQCRYDHPEKRADCLPVSQQLLALAKFNRVDISDGISSKSATEPLPGFMQRCSLLPPEARSSPPNPVDQKSFTTPLQNVPKYVGNNARRNLPVYSRDEEFRGQMEKLTKGGRTESTSPAYPPSNPQVPTSPYSSGHSIGFNSGYQPSPYSSPNNTALLVRPEASYRGDPTETSRFAPQQMNSSTLISRGPKMVSVPHGPSALSGPSMNGTFPFSNNHMRPSVREHNMYNSSATLLPSSYQQQYHYHQPRRTDLEMNSDPSDTRSFRSMHRSVSVQEGSDSQQTRRHIFNNLSNIFGMDLVQYVMTLHPQEVNVEKLMFLLNKEQMTRLGNGSMRL